MRCKGKCIFMQELPVCFLGKNRQNTALFTSIKGCSKSITVNIFLRVAQIDKVQGEACLYAEKNNEISSASSQYHYQKEEKRKQLRARVHIIYRHKTKETTASPMKEKVSFL